jgi:hypothetical protein
MHSTTRPLTLTLSRQQRGRGDFLLPLGGEGQDEGVGVAR